jgi:putative ABC transport system permease protein
MTMTNIKTPLAFHNLLHQPVRSGVALLGVMFAAVLMFMQLGFLEAVKASATVTYDILSFDICVRSRDYARLTDARTFDRARLHAALEVPGVATATPMWVGIFSWRNPKTGEPRAILALGVPDSAVVFRDRGLQERVDRALDQPRAMLVDTLTRREFGPLDGRGFGARDIGQPVEINDRSLKIAGVFTCGSGLSAGGDMIVSQRDFLACQPQFPVNQASLGLLTLAAGSNAAAVAEQLRAALADDVEVLTREELLGSEIRHWVWETNYGLIFQSGVLVAVIVGTAIVYQVLASEVSTRMPEFATLKAIGYDNAYLIRVMVEQSLLLALVAFAAAWLISIGLYEVTAVGAQIPIRMTWSNVLLVLSLTIALCIVSGLAAIRKAYGADPAELF